MKYQKTRVETLHRRVEGCCEGHQIYSLHFQSDLGNGVGFKKLLEDQETA